MSARFPAQAGARGRTDRDKARPIVEGVIELRIRMLPEHVVNRDDRDEPLFAFDHELGAAEGERQ